MLIFNAAIITWLIIILIITFINPPASLDDVGTMILQIVIIGTLIFMMISTLHLLCSQAGIPFSQFINDVIMIIRGYKIIWIPITAMICSVPLIIIGHSLYINTAIKGQTLCEYIKSLKK